MQQVLQPLQQVLHHLGPIASGLVHGIGARAVALSVGPSRAPAKESIEVERLIEFRPAQGAPRVRAGDVGLVFARGKMGVGFAQGLVDTREITGALLRTELQLQLHLP